MTRPYRPSLEALESRDLPSGGPVGQVDPESPPDRVLARSRGLPGALLAAATPANPQSPAPGPQWAFSVPRSPRSASTISTRTKTRIRVGQERGEKVSPCNPL